MTTRSREYVYPKGMTPTDLKSRTMLGSVDDAKREVFERDGLWVVRWSFTPR